MNDSLAQSAPQPLALDTLEPPLALAVPNVSEGRDEAVVAALVDAVQTVGARVVDVHTDQDHNRSVLTVVADPLTLIEGLLALAHACVEHIDLRRQDGAHPRTGALDVAPVVALTDDDMPLAQETAAALADRIGEEVGIPIFRYGAIAVDPNRVRRPTFARVVMTGSTRWFAKRSWFPTPGRGECTPRPARRSSGHGRR